MESADNNLTTESDCNDSLANQAYCEPEDYYLEEDQIYPSDAWQLETLDNNLTTENDCIDSFAYLAYSVPEDYYAVIAQVYPSEPWQFETLVPWKEDHSPRIVHPDITRNIGGQVEVWVWRKTQLGMYIEDIVFEYLIYSPFQKEWKVVSAEIGNSGIYVDKLFVGSDGTIWGRNNYYPSDATLSVDEYPVLSTYNDQTYQFEFVSNSLQIPIITSPAKWPNEITLDQNDVFWFFVQEDGLYSFDIRSGITEKLISLTEIKIDSIGIGIDGNILLQKVLFLSSLQEKEILIYNKETGELLPMEIPEEPWPGWAYMFIDRSGNLWLDSVGRREIDGEWILLHTDSQNYIQNIMNDLRMAHPRLILESSDGTLWFEKYTDTSFGGMAWYDPELEEGCWFTTETGNIVEDVNHILWLVIDEKLYKYDLKP